MTAYEIVNNEVKNVRVRGEMIEAKPYSLNEVWLNVSKFGNGYYFVLENEGKKYFINVDMKTANDRRFFDFSSAAVTGLKAMKVNANGYLYKNSKGYAQYVIRDLNNFEKVYNV